MEQERNEEKQRMPVGRRERRRLRVRPLFPVRGYGSALFFLVALSNIMRYRKLGRGEGKSAYNTPTSTRKGRGLLPRPLRAVGRGSASLNLPARAEEFKLGDRYGFPGEVVLGEGVWRVARSNERRHGTTLDSEGVVAGIPLSSPVEPAQAHVRDVLDFRERAPAVHPVADDFMSTRGGRSRPSASSISYNR